MPLTVPNLDDRKFQDILDEARRLIPRYCPEWTDHNLSDPGITLLELFAWMTDMMLYRLNRVPDKNYVKFLELLGIDLLPARPATADVTFRLTAAQPQDVVIPRGTEVATVRTDAHQAVPFATERDLTVRVPHLRHVLSCRGGTRFHDYQAALDDPAQRLGVFSEVPREHDALYLGFGNDLSANTLLVNLECELEGIGIDPTNPPLAWETWDGTELLWVPLAVREDTSSGLDGRGHVVADVPYSASPTAIDGRPAFWIRCRVVGAELGRPAYAASPRIAAVSVESIGGLVPARHSTRIEGETIGTSDGTPGQTFTLSTIPVLPRRDGETLEVEQEDGTFALWTEVEDFGDSGQHAPHFTLDDTSGTLALGPLIRTPGGREQQYGQVPPAGRALRMTRYWSGGGLVGNVGAQTITVVKTAIPYVAWVTNFTPAMGGTESEDIEHAKMRGPRTLRTQERAVTPEDFERLALQASPAVARARCQVIGGHVSTVVETAEIETAALPNAPVGASGIAPARHGGNGAAGIGSAAGAGGDLDRILSPFTGVRRGAAGGRRTRIGERGGTDSAPAGFVRLLLVPALHEVSSGITPEQLQLSPRLRREVHDYLDDRRLVTSELVLGTPIYTWVSVAARVRAMATADRAIVALRARETLNRFVHPVLGGPDGTGWPFGRDLYLGEVYALLQQVPGVEVVEEVSLYHIDPHSGASGPPVTRLGPGAGGILVSHNHQVTVQ